MLNRAAADSTRYVLYKVDEEKKTVPDFLFLKPLEIDGCNN